MADNRIEILQNNIIEIFKIEDPSVNRCKKVAYAIRQSNLPKAIAFSILANMVDYGVYNMISDEYRWYFGL